MKMKRLFRKTTPELIHYYLCMIFKLFKKRKKNNSSRKLWLIFYFLKVCLHIVLLTVNISKMIYSLPLERS
jgi:hypothetical protein